MRVLTLLTVLPTPKHIGRVNFIYDTLMELTKYEKYGIYTGSTPTADIEKLNRDLESSVNAFVDRAYEAQLIKVCNLKTEKGKLNSLEKFFDSMYAAFDCANTFWSGNGVRAHYTGPLITAGNRAYLDALHEDCMKAYGIDQDMTPLINKVSHKASKSELVFDDTKEKELIAEYNKYKNTSSSGAYYAALPLIDFYYKYRSLDKKYLILCMEYCNICISLLNIPDMQQYVSEGIVIPAFKKLVIIYDKKKEYKKALEIIDKAIKYDRDTDYYEKKRAAILKKMIK